MEVCTCVAAVGVEDVHSLIVDDLVLLIFAVESSSITMSRKYANQNNLVSRNSTSYHIRYYWCCFIPELMHLFTLPDHVQESSSLFRLTECAIGSRNAFGDVSYLRCPICPMTYVEMDLLVIWVLGTVGNVVPNCLPINYFPLRAQLSLPFL